MSTTESRHITLVEVLIAGGLIVLSGVAAVYIQKKRVADRHRNHCVGVLRQLDGAKDQYALEYGGTNGTLFTWYELSLYIRDISNYAICTSSSGRMTNIPNDCYSIEPLGKNPQCRISKPEDGHALTNR